MSLKSFDVNMRNGGRGDVLINGSLLQGVRIVSLEGDKNGVKAVVMKIDTGTCKHK